jgi:hypothetical protein
MLGTEDLLPEEIAAKKEAEAATPQTWSGRPSVFACTPKTFLYAIIILFIIKFDFWLYPYALSYQKHMLLHAGQTISYWKSHDWRTWCLIASGFVMVYCFIKIILGFLNIMLTRYSVCSDQLTVRNFESFGYLEQRAELYRIVDFARHTPVLGMAFGFTNITLKSTDRSTPVILLKGIRKGDSLLDLLRNETERCRQIKGIREFTSPFS